MSKVKIVNKGVNPLPEYKTPGSSGMDLMAWLEEPLTLESLERALVPTGLYIELQPGYEAQIRPRSGMSIKHGLTLINAVGTIDSDYRGELRIPVVNLSREPFTIHDSDRGEGGFGSTGR